MGNAVDVGRVDADLRFPDDVRKLRFVGGMVSSADSCFRREGEVSEVRARS